MIAEASCDAIIAEAARHVGSLRTLTVACSGWRIPPSSAAAAALTELGWPTGDAQVVRYGQGGGYERHVDGGGRLEVLMVQLSDPGGYEGGLVVVDGEAEPMATARGAASVWSAQVPHRVAEVTAGERWALVAWR